MLHSIKHQNIPSFMGFSDAPYSLMMEYVAFDFARLGLEKSVSSLEDFYHFVDCEFDFNSFADVLPVCITDVVTGLNFLHQMEIAHRDLKPSNVLVSNQHYCNSDKSSFTKEYERCPIVCKVADFGLSRSLDTQTGSVLQTRTDDICRGTPVYMAPEIHTGLLGKASQDDLKKTDIWSLGLLAFSMVNPNLTNPYRKDTELLGIEFNMETMKKLMPAQQLPAHDTKYESLRVTEWWQVEEIFSMCAKFLPESRPVISDVFKIVNIEDPEASLIIKPLSISQSSAIENVDATLAQQMQTSTLQAKLDEQSLRVNDGTNACTFLAIAMCDALLDCQRPNSDRNESLTHLTELAEDLIKTLPKKINCLRNISEKYELSKAKDILESNGMLSTKYQLSEECVSGSGVFSESGRNELLSSLCTIPSDIRRKVGVYNY